MEADTVEVITLVLVILVLLLQLFALTRPYVGPRR